MAAAANVSDHLERVIDINRSNLARRDLPCVHNIWNNQRR
jgi:hypothetical protein